MHPKQGRDCVEIGKVSCFDTILDHPAVVKGTNPSFRAILVPFIGPCLALRWRLDLYALHDGRPARQLGACHNYGCTMFLSGKAPVDGTVAPYGGMIPPENMVQGLALHSTTPSIRTILVPFIAPCYEKGRRGQGA